jgi:hypothetical protein
VAFGIFFPRFRANRVYPGRRGDLNEVVRTAFTELKWPIKGESGNSFTAEVPLTAFSYWRYFKVNISENGQVDAESKSAGREMFFDCGRNKTRVDRFFEKIDEILERKS